MHWSQETSDALAALRTLMLNAWVGSVLAATRGAPADGELTRSLFAETHSVQIGIQGDSDLAVAASRYSTTHPGEAVGLKVEIWMGNRALSYRDRS